MQVRFNTSVAVYPVAGGGRVGFDQVTDELPTDPVRISAVWLLDHPVAKHWSVTSPPNVSVDEAQAICVRAVVVATLVAVENAGEVVGLVDTTPS